MLGLMGAIIATQVLVETEAHNQKMLARDTALQACRTVEEGDSLQEKWKADDEQAAQLATEERRHRELVEATAKRDSFGPGLFVAGVIGYLLGS